ncbi:DUF1127 domain-containing protein [Rhizobium sp. FY34]|uniref:DUF1127 domain-containing protein n=1 Tax=Rhizobium sp. FY34 TaxID=2562309 RepID=UPI001FF00460|nr:DUF1127 domain-containing protein [Rhizobium sp. FY34]
MTMMTINLDETRTPAPKAVETSPRFPVWAGLMARVSLWQRHRRTRQQLADLSPEQLQDVGLSRRQAEYEVRRSRLLLIDGPQFPPM